MKQTDDYTAGNSQVHKSRVDERYGLISSVEPSFHLANQKKALTIPPPGRKSGPKVNLSTPFIFSVIRIVH
jgi:hypothetical protein